MAQCLERMCVYVFYVFAYSNYSRAQPTKSI